MEKVKLLGEWTSPFCFRVVWALKLKGISHEYVEEDLDNKSSLLIQYNPVHKKVPVLVHNGKAICESLVILEYIDETWPHDPPLLPPDSYRRALVRFWAQFTDDKGSAFWRYFSSKEGEEQEKAKKETLEMLRTLEEHAFGPQGNHKFIGGVDEISIADLALGWICVWGKVMENIVGVKLLSEGQFPQLHAWMDNFTRVSAIGDNSPDQDRLLACFKELRQKLINMAS